MKISRFILISFIAISIFFLPAFVLAHGTGATLEKVVGDYLIDVGYNPEVIEAGDSVIFDFDLLVNKTGERAEFSEIWIRIVQDGQTFFASGIDNPSFGATTLLYTFADAGDYELTIRFQEEGEALIETSFPLQVEAGSKASGSKFRMFPWILLGGAIGATGGFLVAFMVIGDKRKPV